MALPATMHTFDIDLSDVDRNVYETFSLKVARHPSETEEYLLTRVLAYCLEYKEGITFSKGLADPEDPPLSVRDLTGAITVWIEIGFPDAARVHKASKAAPRLAIYTHKEPRLLLRQWEGQRIHRAEAVELYEVDRALLSELTTHLDRRVKFTMSVSDRQLYIDIGGHTLHGTVERHPLA